MQRIICKKLYDTDTATLIFKITAGALGDTDGYEECLFKTPEGSYFLYGRGGADSPYPAESIYRLSEKRAEEWLASNR